MALSSTLLLVYLLKLPFGIPMRFAEKHGLVLVKSRFFRPDGPYANLLDAPSSHNVPMGFEHTDVMGSHGLRHLVAQLETIYQTIFPNLTF